MRFVLSALETGFAEVRFHFSGDPYDPFYLRNGEVVRRPIETAMVALNQWLPVGATLRVLPARKGVAATAIAAPGAQPLVVLDNTLRKTSKLLLSGPAPIGTQVFSPNGAQPTLRPYKGRRTLVTMPAETQVAVRY